MQTVVRNVKINQIHWNKHFFKSITGPILGHYVEILCNKKVEEKDTLPISYSDFQKCYVILFLNDIQTF